MSEDITYKVQIDSGTIVNVGSAQRYNISSLGLTPGSHTFKVIGTCKHNVERDAQKTFNYPAASPAANTLRFAFSNNSTSPLTLNMQVGTWTKVGTVGEYTNVWDWTNNDEAWTEINWGFTESFDPDVRIIDCGDTSNVKNMLYAFMSCNTLTDISGLANMDISNVRNLSGAFYNCTGLLSVDALSSWDVSHIGNFAYMFYGCTSLKSITALASWDVSGVSGGSINGMFYYCSSIESGMKAVYDSWSSLTTVPTYRYCFTGAGTNNASGMAERIHIPTSWGGDGAVLKIIADATVNNTTATISYSITNGGTDTWTVTCNGQTTTGTTGSFEFTNLTAGEYTYTVTATCKHTVEISTTADFTIANNDLTFTFKFSKSVASPVTNYMVDKVTALDANKTTWKYTINSKYATTGYMFTETFSGLDYTVSLIDTSNTQNITNAYDMFQGCDSLTSVDLSTFDASNITNMAEMFGQCSSLVTINFGNNFNTSKVTTMARMFRRCSSLVTINFGNNFNTSKVTTMSGMFDSCKVLNELDISMFDTTNVTSMSSMFYNCWALTSLDLSMLNTHNVTAMGWMFACCKLLSTLNITNFDTSNVTEMYNMFIECQALTSLDFVSVLNIDNVTNMNCMFQDCVNVSSGALAFYNRANATGKVEKHSYTFTNCGKNTTTGNAECAQIPSTWGGTAK